MVKAMERAKEMVWISCRKLWEDRAKENVVERQGKKVTLTPAKTPHKAMPPLPKTPHKAMPPKPKPKEEIGVDKLHERLQKLCSVASAMAELQK